MKVAPSRTILLFSALILALALATCQVAPTAPASSSPSPTHIIADFEQPNSPAVWIAPATNPSTNLPPSQSQPAITVKPLLRSSSRPHSGLWALAANVSDSGTILYTPPKPLDLGRYNIFTAQISQSAAPARNGECIASITLTDADGKKVQSDAYPVLSRWQPITLDLGSAFAHGVNISRIASIAINVHCTAPLAEPLTIQTDTFSADKIAHTWVGSSVGPAKSFFVESSATRIRVGAVGQYEIIFSDRGSAPPAPSIHASSPVSGDVPHPATAPANPGTTPPPPWLEVLIPSEIPELPATQALGQFATGLFLLDQSAFDSLEPFRRQTPDDAPVNTSMPAQWSLPTTSWPASIRPDLTHIQWSVAWTSPLAALIEGTQECGPYDRLGEASVILKWRFMIYQWGQAFVHVQWTKSGESAGGAVPDPVSWALVLDDAVIDRPAGRNAQLDAAEQRLLTDIYPPILRQGLRTALPHRMQTGTPIAMIAKLDARKNSWWWAAGSLSAEQRDRRRYLGAGFATTPGTTGQADCMLLLNSPNALTKAASFGQYVIPAKIVLRQGELDRNFPGDADNDGFVESSGFQAIRLANGRATFTIYPQERPLFYPPFLFTVPAVERPGLDLAHSRLLINVDGKQFANPPPFPDGSFLLQIPYVLDRPVSVEAILAK